MKNTHNMTKKKLFYDMASLFNKSNIPYAILGNTSSYPEQIPSDVDIIVQQNDLGKVKELLWELESENTKIWQMFQHEICAFYYVVALISDHEVVYIQPDICSDYFRKGRKLLSADYLLQETRIARYVDGRSKKFNVLLPAKEFVYYLLKKIDKKAISEKQFQHLIDIYNEDEIGCLQEIESFWNSSNLQVIKKAIDNNDFDLLSRNIEYLQQGIRTPKQKQWSYTLQNVGLKIKRIFNPTGYIIAVMGPDGSGKTTALQQFTKDIAPAFRKIKTYHLFPKEATANAVINTDPHGLPPRTPFLSFLKLIYFVFIYNWGFIRNIYKKKIRSTLVIFDRYYDDILIDPLRYRNGTSAFMVHLLGKLIPQPDYWIVLDAPTEVIQSRKSEVSFEETERQRKAYKLLAENKKNAQIINTDRNVALISKEMCEAIGCELNTRIKKRNKSINR